MGLPADARSVRELVEEHYLGLYRYAYRLSGSAADADDLTQETFFKAQMRLRQLRDPARVKPWLFAILRNSFLRRRRDESAVRVVPLHEACDVAEAEPPGGPDLDPARLQTALAELPEAYRTPLILYYFESFSYREIGEQMGVPIGTVMSRLSRGKACLRRRLGPAGSTTPGGGVQHDL